MFPVFFRSPVHFLVIAVASVLLLAGPASVARAEIQVTTREQNVIISGRSEGEIRRSLDRYHVRHGGAVWWASTTASLGYKATLEVSPAQVRVHGVTITLDMTYKYPRWVEQAVTVQRVVRKWEEVRAILRIHEENGHGGIWREAARELETAILTLPPQPSEQAMDSRMQEVFSDVMARSKARHEDFDARDTSSGRISRLFPPSSR